MFGFDLPLWLIGLGGGLKRAVGGLFRFATRPPGVYIVAALVVLGAWWWDHNRAYDRGVKAAKAEEQQHIMAAELAAFKRGLLTQIDLDKGLYAAGVEFGRKTAEAKTNTVFLTKEVPKYVTIQIDREFPLPCGLLKLLDAAADGTSPSALGDNYCGDDGAPASVKASDLATVVIFNYGLYHRAEAQVVGLQRALQALVKASGTKLDLVEFAPDGGTLDAERSDLERAGDQEKPNPENRHDPADALFHTNDNGAPAPLVAEVPPNVSN